MTPTPIRIDLLETKVPNLKQQITQLYGTACSPLRVEAEYSSTGLIQACYLRERGYLEALGEELGELFGFQTKLDAIFKAQNAVERHLRHKLRNVTVSRNNESEMGFADCDESLRLLLHARMVGKYQTGSVERKPLEQPGPLLMHWEGQRYLGTVLNGFSVGMRAAETVIADAAILPHPVISQKKISSNLPDPAVVVERSPDEKRAHPNWREAYSLNSAFLKYDKACDTQEAKERRRAEYKKIYINAFGLVYDKARTIVITPLHDYSKLHIQGMLDAIEEKMAEAKDADKAPVHIMVTTEDPYLYPLIRECLLDRTGKLQAAVPLFEENFATPISSGVRISDIRRDQWDEVMYFLMRLVSASNAPLRISVEQESGKPAIYLHERSPEAAIEECFMSTEKLAARKAATCKALDTLFAPMIAAARQRLNGKEMNENSGADASEPRCSAVVKRALAADPLGTDSGLRPRNAALPVFEKDINSEIEQFVCLQLTLEDLKYKVETGKRMTRKQFEKNSQLKRQECEKQLGTQQRSIQQVHESVAVPVKQQGSNSPTSSNARRPTGNPMLSDDEDEENEEYLKNSSSSTAPKSGTPNKDAEDTERPNALLASGDRY